MNTRFRTWITTPRWSPVKHIILEGCFKFDVEFRELSYEKGLLINTIYFEISGERDRIVKFSEALNTWALENGLRG